MDQVAVSAFRADMREWLEKVRAGEEVVLTDRGMPFARVVRIDAVPLLERLAREGVITRAKQPKRRAAGRPRVRAKGSVSELVSELRR